MYASVNHDFGRVGCARNHLQKRCPKNPTKYGFRKTQKPNNNLTSGAFDRSSIWVQSLSWEFYTKKCSTIQQMIFNSFAPRDWWWWTQVCVGLTGCSHSHAKKRTFLSIKWAKHSYSPRKTTRAFQRKPISFHSICIVQHLRFFPECLIYASFDISKWLQLHLRTLI